MPAITTAARRFADGGAAGIKSAIAAGAMATAAATESLATASMNDGHGGGSLIGSLAQMNTRSRFFAKTASPPANEPLQNWERRLPAGMNAWFFKLAGWKPALPVVSR